MFIYCIRNIKTGVLIRGFETEEEAFNELVQKELSDIADGIFEFDTYQIIREEVVYG